MNPRTGLTLFALLAASCGLVHVPVATAATVVPGQTILVNTTWDLAGSPYIVQGDVNVSANVTLRLEAGVQVLFDGYHALRILGGLDGVGNATDPVAFDSYQAVPGIGDWVGVVLEDGARANLSFVEFRHAYKGLDTRGDNLALNNLTFEQNQIAGLEVSSGTNVTLTDSSFTSNLIGVRLASSAFNTMQRLNLTANRIGLVLLLSNDNLLTHSTFLQNEDFGVDFVTSLRNTAYTNSFVGNGVHARDNTGSNVWDGGYALGGNLWENWTSPDDMTGPNQTLPGSDGLVDLPYWIDGDSQDRYPLAVALPGLPPIITLVSPVNGSHLAPGRSVELQVLDRDLAGAEYAVDGGTPVPFNDTATVNTSLWTDGPHLLSVEAWDLGGNWTSRTFNFQVDGTAPVVTLLSPPLGSLIRPGMNVQLQVLESNLVGVDVSVDGDIPVAVSAPWALVTDTWLDGNRSVSVTAVDLAGNTGTSTLFFLVDGTRPVANVTNPPAGSSGRPWSETVRIAFSEPMNRTSVEDALTYGGASYSPLWSENDTRLALVLASQLAPNTTFEVHLNPAATDLAGNPLVSGLDLSFTTVAEVPPPIDEEPFPVLLLVLAAIGILAVIGVVLYMRSRRRGTVPPETQK